MAGPTAHVAALAAALLLAGCGSPVAAKLPVACLEEPAAIARALERAPAAVTLSDGTALSRCVRLARNDADLQALGVSFTQVADGLRPRAESDPVAALRLGYLVGAVRRGAAGTPGIASQLARRVEQVAAIEIDAGAARTALQRGIGLGESGG